MSWCHDALQKGETLPLQPWAEQVARERLSRDDHAAKCLTAGVPRQAPYPWRILQTPTHVFFLFEGNIHSHRQIFVDGRYGLAAQLEQQIEAGEVRGWVLGFVSGIFGERVLRKGAGTDGQGDRYAQ